MAVFHYIQMTYTHNPIVLEAALVANWVSGAIQYSVVTFKTLYALDLVRTFFPCSSGHPIKIK